LLVKVLSVCAFVLAIFAMAFLLPMSMEWCDIDERVPESVIYKLKATGKFELQF
jgi:hypothetical protein